MQAPPGPHRDTAAVATVPATLLRQRARAAGPQRDTAAMATVPTTLPRTSTCEARVTIGFSSALSFLACARRAARQQPLP